jgi:hypothetical protein
MLRSIGYYTFEQIINISNLKLDINKKILEVYMGRCLNYFKSFEITEKDGLIFINYTGGDSISLCYSNAYRLIKLFHDNNINIPILDRVYINSEAQSEIVGLKMINPSDMVTYCDSILNCNIDSEYLIEYIHYIKELSKKGFYISLDKD